MTTIRDLARAAGVSMGTISNFLNDPDVVAPETRARIQAKIDELGYHPRAAARSLKSRRTRQIGLVPVISPAASRSVEPGDAAFLEFLAGINTVSAERGYAVLIAAAAHADDELAIYDRLIGERRVDGVAVLGVRPGDERIAFLLRAGFPFVTFGRSNIVQPDGQVAHSFVDIDGAGGVRLAVEHLAALGHRRIAYVAPPPDLMCASQRWDGFASSMADHDLPLDESYIVAGGFHESVGRRAAAELLDLPRPPTAIIAANDLCALGVMTTVKERGLIVGEDVSVVGFDDIEPANHWNPALTTVVQPFRRIGMAVVESLLECLGRPGARGDGPVPQVVIEARLVVRSSTGPASEGR